MTTAPDTLAPEATDPHATCWTTEPHATCWRGADLLQTVLAALGRIGYRRIAVDTWRHDSYFHSIRHHYSGGLWELACWGDRHGTRVVQRIDWPDHTSAARVERLLRGLLPPGLATPDWHLGDLTAVR